MDFGLQKRLLTILLFFILLLNLLMTLALPVFNMLIIDSLNQRKIEVTLISILFLAIALIINNIMTSLDYFISRYLETISGYILNINLLENIRNMSNITNARKYLPLFSNDINKMKLRITFLLDMLIHTIHILSVCTIIVIFTPNLFFIILFLLILLPIVPLIVSRFLPKFSFLVQEKDAKLINYISDSLKNSKEIRLLQIEKHDKENLICIMKKKLASILKLESLNATFSLNNLISSFFTIVTFVVGSFLVYQNQITVGELIALSMYIGGLLMPIKNLIFAYNQLKIIYGSTLRYEKTLNQKQWEVHKDSFSKINEEGLSKPIIEYHNVNITHDRNGPLYKNNFDLKITEGDWVLIKGKSGTGKTSLFNSLTRLDDRYRGEIYINGNNIKMMSKNNLYKDIFYILQDHSLFEGDLMNDSMYEIKNKEKYLSILIDLNLDHLINEKSELVIDNNNISGGEKQRLLLSIGIYYMPKILILDEPTSALDENNSKDFIKILKKYRKNKTTIIISHDKTFNFIDKIVEL